MNNNFDFVYNFPGLAGLKNAESVYLSVSKPCAEMLGWKSILACHGKTDFDIPCEANELADEFIKLDQLTIKSNTSMLTFDIHHYADGWKFLLVERTPLKNAAGEISEIFARCMDVTKLETFKSYFLLHQIDKKISGENYRPVSYILSETHNPLPLTKKQENCLFFLIRGHTLDEIAKKLNVTKKTIEGHIEAIKNKLHCQCKSDLIEKAIDSGFIYYIPSELQKSKLILTTSNK